MPIAAPKRLAIALYTLATKVECRTIGKLFEVGKSAVCSILYNFIRAVVAQLVDEFIQLPKGASLQSVLDGFLNRWNFPQCIGAVDGTHFDIKAPQEMLPITITVKIITRYHCRVRNDFFKNLNLSEIVKI